eukprot:327033-Prymnesium_polylepis.1
MGHFRSFRHPPKAKVATFAAFAALFRAKSSPRAYATAFADFRESSARFGSYLRSTCASDAEAWTSGTKAVL